jgi:hypothetical protein
MISNVKLLVIALCLSGCADEIRLAKEDPVIVSGATAVFIGTVLGLSR